MNYLVAGSLQHALTTARVDYGWPWPPDPVAPGRRPILTDLTGNKVAILLDDADFRGRDFSGSTVYLGFEWHEARGVDDAIAYARSRGATIAR